MHHFPIEAMKAGARPVDLTPVHLAPVDLSWAATPATRPIAEDLVAIPPHRMVLLLAAGLGSWALIGAVGYALI